MRTRLLAVVLAVMLALSGCAAIPLSSPTATDGATVTVTEVVDGDTVRVEFPDGTADTVRLLGVDTPEVHVDNDPAEFEGVPDTEAGAACLRRWGDRASTFARERLRGASVTLRFDANEPRRGSYDRLLAYVLVDGDPFNRQLVAQGYARVYDSEFTKRTTFYDLESTAQDQRQGLWACRDPAATATSTPSATGLRVSEVHADAAGDDRANLDDEYVVFENAGDDTLDLSGWQVSDAGGHAYEFPTGTELAPGETLVLHTGEGTDGDGHRYWGASGPVWNNGGDEIRVENASGGVVLVRSY